MKLQQVKQKLWPCSISSEDAQGWVHKLMLTKFLYVLQDWFEYAVASLTGSCVPANCFL